MLLDLTWPVLQEPLFLSQRRNERGKAPVLLFIKHIVICGTERERSWLLAVDQSLGRILVVHCTAPSLSIPCIALSF